MNERSKLRLLLIFLIFILCVIIGVALILAIFFEEEILSILLFGTATSLLSWIIIELLWFFIGPLYDSRFNKLEKLIKEERLRPKFKARHDIASDYYNAFYKKARKIYCSGIAVTDIINELFPLSKKIHKSVLSECIKKHELTIKLMLLDPTTPYLEYMKKERKKQIIANLKQVIDYCKKACILIDDNKIKNKAVPDYQVNCSLEIKLTRSPLNSTLFYYEPKDNDNHKRKMLVGMLYEGVDGRESEAYELEHSSVSRFGYQFDHNLKNFESLWGKAHSFLKIHKTNKTDLSLTLTDEIRKVFYEKDIHKAW